MAASATPHALDFSRLNRDAIVKRCSSIRCPGHFEDAGKALHALDAQTWTEWLAHTKVIDHFPQCIEKSRSLVWCQRGELSKKLRKLLMRRHRRASRVPDELFPL